LFVSSLKRDETIGADKIGLKLEKTIKELMDLLIVLKTRKESLIETRMDQKTFLGRAGK